MKTIITHLCILVSLIAFTASAAPRDKKIKPEKPDMEAIKASVTDPNSKFYYPRLMAESEKNYTALQLEAYRHLYYGYIFQEDYDPYRKTAYSQKVSELYERNKHTRAECDTIIKYAELSLKDNPFDLQQINYLIYALREKKKIHLANIWQYKLNHILQAIVSSGTGINPENAWYVVIPSNEYHIINFMGYQVTRQEFEKPYFDHIFVTKSDSSKKTDKDPEAFYFNIEDILREYNRKNPE